jgi:hypothetical protein
MPQNETQIPAEYWPIIDLLYTGTIVVAVLWVVLAVFVHMRRRASNLTPIQAAKVNRKAQPGFLDVDHRKQHDMARRSSSRS